MNNLRYALRQLLKNPGFTAVAVLTLALGIGSCAAMFSVVHAVLWRPLPFQDTSRLVWIENTDTGGLSGRTSRADTLLDWRAQNKSFEKLGGYNAFFDYGSYTLVGSGEPQRLRGVSVSKNFLDVLGIQPLLGRTFVDEECAFNGRSAAILSHSFWQKHFAADEKIIGQSVTLNGNPTEIVGVLPPSFDFDSIFAPGTEVELLLPFPLTLETARQGNTLFVIGRLKPSVTIEQARAEFEVMNRQIAAAYPERYGFGARLTSLETSIRGSFRPALFVLSGAVACVLLIACVNLSNLLLSRANARRKEFAVRIALGAGRWALIRQTLTESLLLAVCGCAFGIPMAVFATATLAELQAFNIPLLQTASVDASVLGFTILVACLAGILCGTLPAWRLSGFSKNRCLSEETSQRGSAGKNSALVSRSLVIAEVALACVLLVGAGLLIRSFSELLQVNLGFQPSGAIAWRVDATRPFQSPAEANRYYEQLVQKVAAVPGVESVGLTDTLPLGRNRTWGAGAKGVSYTPETYPIVFPRIVDHGYLQTMRVPLLSGRYFNVDDTADKERVMVINETMARRLWPDRDAVGQIAMLGTEEWRVIGVVADVRHGALEEKPGLEMYFDFRQMDDWSAIELVVRTSRPSSAVQSDIRAAIRAFDSNLPSSAFKTLEQIVDYSVAPRRLITNLLGTFSSLALILASLGLYGVIAHSVSQRTREIGIRLAVGAQRQDVLRLVVGEGLTMAIIGTVLGLIVSLVVTRVLQSMLFGVTATDPFIFTINAVSLIAVAFLACLIPARRAAKVDPMEALRSE